MEKEFANKVLEYCTKVLDLHNRRHPLSKDLSDSQFIHAIRCVLSPGLQAFLNKEEFKEISGLIRLSVSKSLLKIFGKFYQGLTHVKLATDIYAEHFSTLNANGITVCWELIL